MKGQFEHLKEKTRYFPHIYTEESRDSITPCGPTHRMYTCSTFVRKVHKGKWYKVFFAQRFILEGVATKEECVKHLVIEVYKFQKIGVITNIHKLDRCQIGEGERLLMTLNNYLNHKSMIIETKFNIGDEAYILLGNQIHKVVIKRLEYTRGHKIQEEKYYIDNPIDVGFEGLFNHSELFKTKQDLLDSL